MSNSGGICKEKISGEDGNFQPRKIPEGFLTSGFRRCAGTSRTAGGAEAALSSSSSVSLSALGPSEVTGSDLRQQNRRYSVSNNINESEVRQDPLLQVVSVLGRHRGGAALLGRLLHRFLLPARNADLNLVSLWMKPRSIYNLPNTTA